jgi:hypothetical protein
MVLSLEVWPVLQWEHRAANWVHPHQRLARQVKAAQMDLLCHVANLICLAPLARLLVAGPHPEATMEHLMMREPPAVLVSVIRRQTNLG